MKEDEELNLYGFRNIRPSPISDPLGEEEVEELKELEDPEDEDEEAGLRQEYRRKLRRLRTSSG